MNFDQIFIFSDGSHIWRWTD